MKCRGPCGENKPGEAFEIRGEPIGEGICYECTKLIRKEKRKLYLKNYYRDYRKEHPEETMKAQRKAQEKLKARRREARLQKAIKAFVEGGNILTVSPEVREETNRFRRLDAIKGKLEETREELKLEMGELRKKGDLDLLEEIERHEARTLRLIRSIEDQMKGIG